MQRENRECVTIYLFVLFSGGVCMCHVLFGAKGITSHMAPEEAVTKIKNVLISTTEHGSQDHKSLLAVYKLFDNYLTENNIERPVVVLSDGHSSRFDFDVLLRNHQIRLLYS